MNKLVITCLTGLFVALAFAGCKQYPKCSDDDDCYEYREYCADGMCGECRLSKHCPTGRKCIEGACEQIQKWCNDDSDCPGKLRCRDKTCGPECLNSAECPQTTSCFNGSCG